MNCGPACPTGALQIVTDRTDVHMGSVALDVDRCLSYKTQRIRDEQDLLQQLGREPTESTASDERRGPCGECFMFCPLRGKAITLRPGGFLAPLIHEDHCVGCGMCEEICRQVVRGDPAIYVVRRQQSTDLIRREGAA
jgi:ferredoxin-type protein NapG